MAFLQLSNFVAEREITSTLGRSSINLSLVLRLLNCAAWASAWRYARKMPWRLSMLAWLAGMISIELTAFRFLLRERQCYRQAFVLPSPLLKAVSKAERRV